MASKAYDEEDGLIAEINIVPFVDIVLVLLIIFMLTSSLIAKESISVDLPQAATADESVSSTVNIVLNAQNELFLNGRATDEKKLAAAVAREAWRTKNVQAVISADKRVDYGRVVSIIDVVKENGIKSFALNIERQL